MKKPILIFILLQFFSSTIFAQTDSSRVKPNETQYLLNPIKLKVKNLGIYLEPQAGAIISSSTIYPMAGASLMLLINKTLAAGFSGSVIGSNTNTTDFNKIAQGGLKLEYTFRPNAKIHPTLPLFIGSQYAINQRNGHNYQRNFENRGNTGARAGVIGTGIGLEGNISKHVKVNIGAGYQHSFATKLDSGQKPTNGVTATISIKVGIMDHLLKSDSLTKKKK